MPTPLFVQTSSITQQRITPAPGPDSGDRTGPALKAQRQARGIDEDALVREHLPLIQYAVAELTHRIPAHVNRGDLVSAGMLGLTQAARGFDPDRGIAFDRFASTRIRGALLDELRGRDWASRSVRARARRMQSVTTDLTTRLGRTPNPGEVADAMGLDAAAAHKLVDDVHRATVLNYESLTAEGSSELVLVDDGESPEDAIVSRERRAYLTDAVAALPDRLRRVVVGYFFDERSMQELADELGVTESRVSQMRGEALMLIKEGITAHLNPDALPAEARPNGRIAKRKAAYYAQVAAGSTCRERLDAQPLTVQEKITSRVPRVEMEPVRKAS
jgi:RNA polymerase sigma factor for flagellar operon FliA